MVTTTDTGTRTENLVRDPADMFGRTKADCVADHKERVAIPACRQGNEVSPTVEQVAGLVAGIPAVGKALDALRKAGWRATLAGNRITINDEVLAQFIGRADGGPAGSTDGRWVIYSIAGTPPVWVVGVEPALW